MGPRIACAFLCLVMAAGAARADDPYPFAGVFSFLETKAEKTYSMDKFPCLASFSIQRGDGSYTAYHIDSNEFGKGVKFHPYEIGTCAYSAVKNMEQCKVSKSNWGESEYFVQHTGMKDGVEVVQQVNLKTPMQMTEMTVRKCPFDAAQIAPFLADDFLNYSDDDFSWTMYRWLDFNPDLGAKIAKALGIASK